MTVDIRRRGTIDIWASKRSLRLPRRAYSPRLEPAYLDEKPPIPEYDEVQLDLKGYDFVPLERYTKHIHCTLMKFDIGVECIPIPAKTSSVKLYYPRSVNVRDEYSFTHYHRCFKISGLRSVDMPMIMELLLQNQPQGISLSLSKVDPEQDDYRYVPTLEVQALKEQLELLDNDE